MKKTRSLASLMTTVGAPDSSHQTPPPPGEGSVLPLPCCGAVHNAYIEQLKFLAVVCARTMPQKSQKYMIEYIFFLAQTTLRKIEKIRFL